MQLDSKQLLSDYLLCSLMPRVEPHSPVQLLSVSAHCLRRLVSCHGNLYVTRHLLIALIFCIGTYSDKKTLRQLLFVVTGRQFKKFHTQTKKRVLGMFLTAPKSLCGHPLCFILPELLGCRKYQIFSVQWEQSQKHSK